MTDEPTIDLTLTPMLGRLPPDPNKRALYIGPLGVAVPLPPISADHLTGVPLEMDGNDNFSDCVVVSFRNHFYATWMALRPGEPVPKITRQDCLDFYWAMVGTKTPPGPGLVTEIALDYLLKHGLGGQVPLAWARFKDDLTTIEVVNGEFVAGIYGVEIHKGQMYPAPIWDPANEGIDEGGHEICGGKHDPNYVYGASWGMLIKMTHAFVTSNLGEHHLIIWQHVWDQLSYERQVQIAADFLTLTGRQFPVTPVPPTSPYTPRTAMNFTAIAPVRLVDSRKHLGLSRLAPRVLNTIKVAGVSGIPADAIAITGKVGAVSPSANGWLNLSPVQTVPVDISTIDFPVGGAHDIGFTLGLDSNGNLTVYSIAATDIILDVTGYFTA